MEPDGVICYAVHIRFFWPYILKKNQSAVNPWGLDREPTIDKYFSMIYGLPL